MANTFEDFIKQKTPEQMKFLIEALGDKEIRDIFVPVVKREIEKAGKKISEKEVIEMFDKMLKEMKGVCNG